jgi:hypothetical protein
MDGEPAEAPWGLGSVRQFSQKLFRERRELRADAKLAFHLVVS